MGEIGQSWGETKGERERENDVPLRRFCFCRLKETMEGAKRNGEVLGQWKVTKGGRGDILLNFTVQLAK